MFFIYSREIEKKKHKFVVQLMHSLVYSCLCPDWGLNLQLWHVWMILQPTELPGQDPEVFNLFCPLSIILPSPTVENLDSIIHNLFTYLFNPRMHRK